MTTHEVGVSCVACCDAARELQACHFYHTYLLVVDFLPAFINTRLCSAEAATYREVLQAYFPAAPGYRPLEIDGVLNAQQRLLFQHTAKYAFGFAGLRVSWPRFSGMKRSGCCEAGDVELMV
jgi:hypothetical protein